MRGRVPGASPGPGGPWDAGRGRRERPAEGVSGVFIERIRIANFKSLKDVEIRPSGLTALVGPNNAGKSNFALAMNFLAEVHQHGLEAAIARAGGIENIALRKMRRSKSPVAFGVEVGIVCRRGAGELQHR